MRDEVLRNKAFVGASSIQVPWLYFVFLANAPQVPSFGARLNLVYRWNQNLHHYGTTAKTRDVYTKGVNSKPVYQPGKGCFVGSPHKANCKEGAKVSGINGKRINKQGNPQNMIKLREAQARKGILVIHHYRYLSETDFMRQCRRKQSFMVVKPKCKKKLKEYLHPEVFDPSLVVKMQARGSLPVGYVMHVLPRDYDSDALHLLNISRQSVLLGKQPERLLVPSTSDHGNGDDHVEIDTSDAIKLSGSRRSSERRGQADTELALSGHQHRHPRTNRSITDRSIKLDIYCLARGYLGMT